MTTGWKLEREQRARLLETQPPRYPRAVADHVTFMPDPDATDIGDELPAPVRSARIVGRADDGAGVEAMVVAIDGSTARPDGGTWHITWSLGEGRDAKESNNVIAARRWEPLDAGAVSLTPARW